MYENIFIFASSKGHSYVYIISCGYFRALQVPIIRKFKPSYFFKEPSDNKLVQIKLNCFFS